MTLSTHRHAFCSCDLELDPMTLIYEHDLDKPIVKMYLLTDSEVSRSMQSKVRDQTEQTDATEHIGCSKCSYRAAFAGDKNGL